MWKSNFDKISAAEYRAIYAELTGDNSVANAYKTKELDERMRVIMKNLTPGLAKDLHINNCPKSIFDKFWDVCNNLINDITGCNDCRHSAGSKETGEVIVNMAVSNIGTRLVWKMLPTGNER